jgi:FkbM family methyltransferase
MNFLRAAKKLSWLTSHPGCRAHPWTLPVRILQWEWYRMRGAPVLLPLFDFMIEARPSDGVGRVICYFREQADLLFEFMKSYLRPGMTFVDVGANIGSHTVHGARLVSDKGRVFSLEADPDTFARLERNVRLNGVTNAILFNQCISDKQGLATFNINPDSARSSLLRKGISQKLLSASTLDNLLPVGVQVDLLKIDVEGADYLVLGGARQIFGDAPPRIVVIEVTSCAREIKEFLLSYGYRLYRFDGNSLAFVEVEWPVFNTYAIRDGMQQEFSNFTFLPLTKAVLCPTPSTAAFSRADSSDRRYSANF